MAHISYVTFAEKIWSPLLRRQVINVLSEIEVQSVDDHEILLFAFLPWSSYIFERTEIENAKNELSRNSVKVITIPAPMPIPYYSLTNGFTGSWKYSWYTIPFIILFSLPILSLHIIFSDVDILHARSYPAGMICMVVSRLFSRLSLVFDPRSDFPEENITNGNWSRNSVSFRSWKAIERKICTSADSVIAISETFISHLQNEEQSVQFDIVPNNVDTDLFSPDAEFRQEYRVKHNLKDKTVIVYSGSMADNGWNNPDEYAQAMKMLLDTGEDLSFLFLVPKWSRRYLVKTFEKAGLRKEQYRIEHPDFEDVPKYLSVADFSIYILDEESIRLGTKFVEYCAVGAPPIVNTHVAGAQNIVKEEDLGGVIRVFDGEESDTTHSTMQSMLLDLKSNRERYCHNCRQYALEHFSTSSASKKYINIYDSILT